MGDEETKNLLKKCAENLLNAVSQLENQPQGSSHVAHMARAVPAAPVAHEAAGLPVVEEHRRLFGFRPPTTVVQAPAFKVESSRHLNIAW